jgi:hypothetical protein
MLKSSSILVLLASVIFAALSMPSRSDAQKVTSALYTIQGDAKAVVDKSSIASVREAEITFGATGQDLIGETRLTLPLFDGKSVEATVTDIEKRTADDVTWRGKVHYAKVDGDVIVTFRKGFYAALIYGPDAAYEIVPRGDKHILVELDQARFPACGGGIKGDEGTVRTSASSNIVGFDSGDRIDVLVVYTTATKNILGGDAQAQAHAQAAVDAANTAYINSKIRQRLRMVHSQEYLYTESGNSSTDLSNLRNDASIATLRNTHNADLVSEISEVTGVCGIGYLMGAASGNQNNAFTVTARSCAVGNLSFAHELGHNMGSQHNPENGSGPTFPYGFGHYVNGSYRTVMSYVDPCPSGCTRVAYFSNPNVIFNGAPTGINNARDNARSINNTADTIAGYRYSGSSLMMLNYNSGIVIPRMISQNFTWLSDNVTGNVRIDLSRDESTNWETLVASTPNDGAEIISILAPVTRRARLRIVSLNNPTVSDSSTGNIIIR